MKSSTERTRAAVDPSGRRPLGIMRAPGKKRLRRRFQSRGPAGPEMVSYSALTIASIEPTSSGRGLTSMPALSWVPASPALASPPATSRLVEAATAESRIASRRLQGRPPIEFVTDQLLKFKNHSLSILTLGSRFRRCYPDTQARGREDRRAEAGHGHEKPQGTRGRNRK